MSNESSATFDLATPRVIAIQDGNNAYMLHCRRITSNDWQEYFGNIVITSEQQGKERINVIDVNSPRLALAESVLIGAEGYKVAGGVELTSIPNFQTRIPLKHRKLLGEILADARPSKETDLVIYPEGETISIDATWSAIQTASGYVMQQFHGLKHVLRTPSEEQHRRYSREASRSFVHGGSRSGRTVYKGAQPLLAKLYDELIISVEGYSVAGEPLANPGWIVREMDMLHKVIAAQELFQPQETATVAGAEGEDE